MILEIFLRKKGEKAFFPSNYIQPFVPKNYNIGCKEIAI
jgi:hypothetical protein